MNNPGAMAFQYIVQQQQYQQNSYPNYNQFQGGQQPPLYGQNFCANPPISPYHMAQTSNVQFTNGQAYQQQYMPQYGYQQPAPPPFRQYNTFSHFQPPPPVPVQFQTSTVKQVHYCEPCDKDFHNIGAYNAHLATHEKCSDCEFSATKKVVIAHYHSKHGTFSGSGYKIIDVDGQKFNVLLGASPEELEQWRAARRKNFPTAAQVAAKLANDQAVVDAGGILPNQAKGSNRNGGKNNVINKNKRSLAVGSASVSATDTSEDHQGGKSDVIESDGAAGGGGEKKRPCVHYIRGKCTAGDTCSFSHAFTPKPCHNYERNGRCRNGNRCMFVHDRAARMAAAGNDKTSSSPQDTHDTNDNDNDNDNNNRSNKRKQPAERDSERGGGGGGSKLFLPKPLDGGERGTLLRHLLRDEISAEDNLILQCFRYLAQHNFLQPHLPTAVETVVHDDIALDT